MNAGVIGYILGLLTGGGLVAGLVYLARVARSSARNLRP